MMKKALIIALIASASLLGSMLLSDKQDVAQSIVFKIGNEVHLYGAINKGVSDKVAALIDEDDTFVVSSHGGYGDEGHKLSKLITKVRILDECISACSLAIANADSIEGGFVGLHRGAGAGVMTYVIDVLNYYYLKESKHPEWAKLFWNTPHETYTKVQF